MRRPLMLRLLALIAASVALALLGASCGGDDDGEPAAPADEPPVEEQDGEAAASGSPFDRDACELLADADVAEVLGEPVEGTFTEGDEATFTPGQCEWSTGEAIDLTDPQAAGILVFVGDHQTFDSTRILAEDGANYEELDGIGDEAYVGGGDGGMRIEDAGITVSLLGVNANDPATQELIADLLGRVAANY